MAPSRWDDRWQRFAESKPLAADGGVVTRRQRGPMATSWWSQRFVAVLESYGLGARMARGRRYARAGQVLELEVSLGLLLAQVQGSRRTPYLVAVRADPTPETAWASLDDALRARVGFVARLLAGELPPDLEEACDSVGIALFPDAWADVAATCSCPDPENPCKHIASVLYVFADQLDDDPWLLLRWRGRTREQLLDHLDRRASGGREDGLPAWWPLVPGRPVAPSRRAEVPVAPAPDPPHRLLARLGPLDAEVAHTPVVDLLAAAYAVIVPTDDEVPPA